MRILILVALVCLLAMPAMAETVERNVEVQDVTVTVTALRGISPRVRAAWAKRRPLLRVLSWKTPLRVTLVPPEARIDPVLPIVGPGGLGRPGDIGRLTPADPATRPKN